MNFVDTYETIPEITCFVRRTFLFTHYNDPRTFKILSQFSFVVSLCVFVFASYENYHSNHLTGTYFFVKRELIYRYL